MSDLLIITGGSRGIGKETISYFVERNWSAINISRTPCNLENVTDIPLDLSAPNEIEAKKSELTQYISEKSRIALIHNAAFYARDNVLSTSLSTIMPTLSVNIISPMLLNTLFIPFMLQGSSIIYIGSTLGEKGVPNSASYVTVKHAIKGLMRATCQDLAEMGIKSCCINPGIVDTQLLKDTMPPHILQHLLENKIIGKRLIQPEEIASIIYFCATTAALNGAVIDANLGERDL